MEQICILHQLNLIGANLIGANLSQANLSEANFRGAEIHGAYLDTAVFCKTIMPDGKINNSGCTADLNNPIKEPTTPT